MTLSLTLSPTLILQRFDGSIELEQTESSGPEECGPSSQGCKRVVPRKKRLDLLRSLSNPVCVKNAKNPLDTSATSIREKRYEPVKAEVEGPIDRQPRQPYQESQMGQ